LAIPAVASEMPLNPRTPVISEMMKKMMAQRSMLSSGMI
jgi:hypothetical protein